MLNQLPIDGASDSSRAAMQGRAVRLVQATTLRDSWQVSLNWSASSLPALKRYWRCDQRALQLLTPRNTSVDLCYLLPDFAKSRLYQFPRQLDRREDCFWTSANFSLPTADDRFFEQAWFSRVIQTEYSSVTKPEYGDIALFVRASGSDFVALHAAVYLAQDLVFTKNGGDVLHPWMISKLADVEAEYGFATPVKTAFFRRRNRSTATG